MKMSKNTLLKKIEQGYRENYCNGEYTLNLVTENKEESMYVLKYTYETGEEIAITITSSYLGQVSFYSHIHHYYISNFNNHTKSVINVMRLLFDLIDCNKDDMLEYYRTVETKETDETEKDVMKVKQDLNTRFGKKEQQYFDTDCLELNNTIIAKIENINYCPNQNTCCIVSPFVHCDYNYKSDNCIKAHKNFIHDCEQVHKQMKAINNPNWHHVSLLTLENIDMDMTSEKWQTYIHVYRDLQQTLSYLRKCKTQDTYDTCFIRYIKRKNLMWDDGKISIAMLNYITAKLSMQNVESGVWASEYEEATNYHKSRRYNKSRVGR